MCGPLSRFIEHAPLATAFPSIRARPCRQGRWQVDHLGSLGGERSVTFHGLRHSHASQLIDRGVDIVTISKRLGHAKPDITLRIYAHLFQKDDGRAAAAINAILKR